MAAKPKKKCCVSTPRCTRCPLRMLAEGTLPAGFTVRHRRLVKVGKDHAKGAAGSKKKVAAGSGKSRQKAGKTRKAAKKAGGGKK
jgi:hypothetical protein